MEFYNAAGRRPQASPPAMAGRPARRLHRRSHGGPADGCRRPPPSRQRDRAPRERVRRRHRPSAARAGPFTDRRATAGLCWRRPLVESAGRPANQGSGGARRPEHGAPSVRADCWPGYSYGLAGPAVIDRARPPGLRGGSAGRRRPVSAPRSVARWPRKPGHCGHRHRPGADGSDKNLPPGGASRPPAGDPAPVGPSNDLRDGPPPLGTGEPAPPATQPTSDMQPPTKLGVGLDTFPLLSTSTFLLYACKSCGYRSYRQRLLLSDSSSKGQLFGNI